MGGIHESSDNARDVRKGDVGNEEPQYFITWKHKVSEAKRLLCVHAKYSSLFL